MLDLDIQRKLEVLELAEKLHNVSEAALGNDTITVSCTPPTKNW